ncbi:MAG: 3-phosphoserine/phosphohydroxythreonine transaminase [Firmicutes bacterium]|nr:3-phosphoserine/phosphohydroxythreonine transaminase [Bacillota bacterium]
MERSQVFNFSAGPAMLPEPVLEKTAAELCNYHGTGMSVTEMSHRGKVFIQIAAEVEQKLRDVMGIPEGYKPLFLQGGATLQFSAVPMNLIGKTGRADYAVTGNFSNSAYKEAQRYGEINLACSSKDRNYSYIPAQDSLKLGPGAAYFHYCMNNTIFGTKWNYIPDTGDVPLVSDVSSCILSEPIDVSRFGLLYAGAQKNMGPSGLTVVIVREDILGEPLPCTPGLLDYRNQIKNDSMVNTPPCFGIYLLGLVLDWVVEMGGLEAMKAYNKEKAQILYDVLDTSDFYIAVAEKDFRSLMNVTFRTRSEELDKQFVKEAAEKGFLTLAGHRLAGGMRASIYNAMPMAGVTGLAAFMRDFEQKNG